MSFKGFNIYGHGSHHKCWFPIFFTNLKDHPMYSCFTSAKAISEKLFDFIWAEVLLITGSLPTTGQASSSTRLTSIVHILSPETDNCPYWIRGRERMNIENISWSDSTKECCRLGRGWTHNLPIISQMRIQLPLRPAEVIWMKTIFPIYVYGTFWLPTIQNSWFA